MIFRVIVMVAVFLILIIDVIIVVHLLPIARRLYRMDEIERHELKQSSHPKLKNHYPD